MDTQVFNKIDENEASENSAQNGSVIHGGENSAVADEQGKGSTKKSKKAKSNKNKNKNKNTGRYAENDKDEKAPSKFITGIFDWVSAILFALVIVVLVMTFCFRMVDVDGNSMMNTLQDGDKVFITGLNYTPEVGDIVVISHGVELNKPIVKRVIAVGGQTVDIDFETGEVTVDNIVLDEPYILGSTTVSADVEFPLTVDDGTVFVLGDNRVISKDSRYSDVGLIDVNNIIGKVQIRVYPFNAFGSVE